jgi:hypothetical protein
MTMRLRLGILPMARASLGRIDLLDDDAIEFDDPMGWQLLGRADEVIE